MLHLPGEQAVVFPSDFNYLLQLLMKAPAHAWYVVAVLMLANAVSFIDRLLLSLLVTPIKAELHLSDTQVSLLQGFAFALFYCLAGLVLARLADRSSRKWIVTAGVTLWCLLTSLSGTARHFWQLFLYRFGVGIGEGTLSPSAWSLIASYFPRERLSLAIGIYGLGITAGIGFAYLGGCAAIQWVATQEAIDLPGLPPLEGWRLVFGLVGVLGLPVAVLTFFVREPARAPIARPASVGEVLAHYRGNARGYSCGTTAHRSVRLRRCSASSRSPADSVAHGSAAR